MEKISQYLEDKKFIQWVFRPNEELELWWQSYKTDNPNEKRNIQKAKNIIQSLETNNKNLSEKEKIQLFSRILKQTEHREQGEKRKIRFREFLKYAAVAVIFFAVGALLFHKKDNFNPQFHSTKITEPFSGDQARLIRPGGDNILLKEKKSVIEHRNDGKIVINDAVVDKPDSPKKETPEMNQLVIPYGKTSEVFLPDGTKVYLNAGSRLIYPEYFVDKTREVFLVGEAFFEVKENKKHPFIVQTTELRVKVTGTQFNLSAYPSDKIIETVLTEGKVKLEQNNIGLFDETYELTPGKMASFNKSTKKTRLTTVNTENYTLWKEGMFKFESSDLSRVIKKLERFYNIRFSYNDPLLGIIKISGKLELGENQTEVLNNLATAASIEIIKKGDNKYEIRK